MLRFVRFATCGIIMIVLATSGRAGTIIKLGLGSDTSADVEFSGGTGGVLSTTDDGDATTTGDQNTTVEYGDFLDASNPDIISPTASFTMDNLVASGPATTFGPLIIQNFTGGTLNLYSPAPANALLLSGTLANSALTGPIGAPATGALFTTSFAMITGGTLQPKILQNSLTLSMSLTDINGGAGFSVGGATAPMLNDFRADVTLNIAGQPVPEPLTLTMLLMGGALAGSMLCRRQQP